MRFIKFVIPAVFFVGATSIDPSNPSVALSTDQQNALFADADGSNFKEGDEYVPYGMTFVDPTEPGKFPLYSSNPKDNKIVELLTLMVHVHWINDLALRSLKGIEPNSNRGRAAMEIERFFGSVWNPNSTGPEDLSVLIHHIIQCKVPQETFHYMAPSVELVGIKRNWPDMMKFMNWVFTEDVHSRDTMVYLRLSGGLKSLNSLSNRRNQPRVMFCEGVLHSEMPKESDLPPREIATTLGKTYILAGMILRRNADSDIYFMDYPYDGQSGVYNLIPDGNLVVETGSDVTIENRFYPFVDNNQPVYKTASYVLMYVEKPTLG